MGILKIKTMPLCLKPQYPHNGSKYFCDLCGQEFTNKHDAKIHHRQIHVKDRKVLDEMLYCVYTQKQGRYTTSYRLILDIDYSNNVATIIQFDYKGSETSYSRWFYTESKYNTKHISLDELKSTNLSWQLVPEGATVLQNIIQDMANKMKENINVRVSINS